MYTNPLQKGSTTAVGIPNLELGFTYLEWMEAVLGFFEKAQHAFANTMPSIQPAK